MKTNKVLLAYAEAKDRYANLGVDTEKALEKLEAVQISLHCWQGDDLSGFEKPEARLKGGGLQVTGSYPGRARNIDELRADLEKAFSLIPGNHRLNLHAIYGDFQGKNVERDAIEPKHYESWIQWVKEKHLKLDFNATNFSHPKADSGFTLSHRDKAIRNFWIEHVKRCRFIASYFGKKLKSPSIHNLWIPDGSKDNPVDRWTPRLLLKNSLEMIYSEKYSAEELKDSVESKLFGIGSEAFVAGSHEFYLGFALENSLMVCLDMGHFHPTESVSDKISSILQFSDEILLHISRGVRWDSDHVVILNDDLRHIAEEIVRGNVLEKVHVALDFFDASLNRVGAWVVGARATLKGFLCALLEPLEMLKNLEDEGDFFSRLALLEELKVMPFGAVWDFYCTKKNVPLSNEWIMSVKDYESKILNRRV
jgi:L-rhamnose isomerase